jgi:alcohol dehydrogenase class IV
MWKAPHGAVCAALLPHVMAANVAALQARAPEDSSLGRYREIDGVLAGGQNAAAWVAELTAALAIPKLDTMGVKAAEIPRLVEKAKLASSMRGNPIVLTDEELTAIARAALT